MTDELPKLTCRDCKRDDTWTVGFDEWWRSIEQLANVLLAPGTDAERFEAAAALLMHDNRFRSRELALAFFDMADRARAR